MTTERKLPKGIIITEECRLSYPNIFKAKLNDDGKPRYTASLIFPNGTPKDKLNAAIAAVLAEKFPDGKGGYDKAKAGRLRFPIRDGKDYSEDPANPRQEYADSYFIGASSKDKPGAILEDHSPADESTMYAGCWVKAALRAYFYDTKGNRGVTFSLEHLMKVRDDDSFGSKTRVEDIFGAPPASAAFSNDDDFMS